MTKHGAFSFVPGSPHSAMSVEKMRQGRLDIPVFALYLSDAIQDKHDLGWAHREILWQASKLRYALFKYYLGLEGGRLINNNLTQLRTYADLGVKYLTLTHNRNTSWADSATDQPNIKGLTTFGKAVIEECNKLGVLVDVSHASDLTAEAAIEASTKPVIASHSGCRSLVNHPRNLSNALISSIVASGGVIGVPFAKRFIGKYAVVHHVMEVVELAGDCDHVAIGSDLDGAEMVPEVKDVSDWKFVVMDSLAEEGFCDEDIAAIAGGNALRLLNS